VAPDPVAFTVYTPSATPKAILPALSAISGCDSAAPVPGA